MQFKSWDGVGTEVMWEGRRLFDVRWPVGMGISCCPGLSLMTNIIFCELWSPNGHPTDHNAVTMKQQNYDLTRKRAKFEVAQPIRCRLSIFTAYTLRYAVTLLFDPVTLTFDLEHL